MAISKRCHAHPSTLLFEASLLFGLVACSQDSGGTSSSGGMHGGETTQATSLQSVGGSTLVGNGGAGGSIASGGNSSSGDISGGGASTSSGSRLGGTPDAGVGTSVKSDAAQAGGTTGGGTVVGGSIRNGGATGAGGTIATGAATNPGTSTATGGAGGKSATGGATSPDTEGCDIGVYDAASPPKVLTLTGNLGVHDPAAIADDGSYYLYQTGLGAKTSKNLTTWTAAGKPLPTPAWLSTAISGVGDLWAPDVSFFGDKYHLYYSGSTFGSNKSCIGHATRESLATGSWTDSGAATLCSNIGSTDDWNAIDPNVVLDAEGTPWLAFGSFWSGLKMVQLDAAGNRVGTKYTSIASRPSKGGALEAPFVVRRCGYFYLFMSWDKCCDGANSTYNIRVARATSVSGPFSDKAGTAALQGGGTLVAQGDDTWAGPGGQSVMIAGTKAYLVYHAYAKSNGTATLRIADLVWDASGWPVPVGP